MGKNIPDMTPECKPIPISSLTRIHFDAWPIWSELYDSEELIDIESWGVTKEQFLNDLERLSLGDEHAAYPVLDLSFVPDRMRIYIRASIRCADNRRLDGYIINPDAYAFGVFVGKYEFTFNTNLAAECQEELGRMAIALGVTSVAVRPIEYTTVFNDKGGSPIAGALAMP